MNSHRSSDKHGNTTVTLLIVFGLIILGSAGFLLLNKKKAPPRIVTTTEVQTEKEAFLAPEPITVEGRPRNIPATDSDAGDTETETASAKKIIRKKSSKNSSAENNNPVSSGTIDTKELSLFINSKFYSVKSCYERRLKVNPMMEGVVDLRITVLPSGKVGGVYVNSDSVGDALMLECVKTTVKKWQFPKPEGGKIIFDKPFNFKKKS